MILHTGNRTDIPAFYSDWFYNRIQAGYVLARSPYNEKLVTRYALLPAVVDLIVFCTKNPLPMLSRLNKLDSFGQLWFVTITPYGKGIEPNVPQKQHIIEGFCTLSRHLGQDAVIWRYDPILLYGNYTLEQHLQSFEKMCRALRGYTKTCVISFVKLYKKVHLQFPELRECTKEERLFLTEHFARIAQENDIRISICGDHSGLEAFNVDTSGCMTVRVMEKALHTCLDIPPYKPARSECCCYLGADIGAYNTCAHFCRYCYANFDKRAVKENMARHNPQSELLIGSLKPEDVVHNAVQVSFKSKEQRLF